MKPRRLLKPAALTLALVLALCSMLTLTRCSVGHLPRFLTAPSLALMDRKAQPHFDLAKQNIPEVARKLSTVSSISRMCWYMATDKAALQKYLTEQLHPVIAPCASGAEVYGVDMNSTVFHELTAEVGKNNLVASAYAVGGLALEAIFLKTLIRSLSRALGAAAVRLAASWSGAAASAVADGPLPFGDVIGVIMGVGGTIWSAYDLWQCRVRLPLEITAVLNAAVDNVREQCRERAR